MLRFQKRIHVHTINLHARTHMYVCSNIHTCVYTPGVLQLHVHTIYLHAHICMFKYTHMCMHTTWCITATCAHSLPARTHMYVQIHTHVYTHHLVYHTYMCTQSTCTHTYACMYALHHLQCLYPHTSHAPGPRAKTSPCSPGATGSNVSGCTTRISVPGTGWPTVPRTFCAHVEQRLLMTLCNATCTTQICVPGTGWPTVLHMSCAHAEQRHLKERRESSQSDKRRTGKR